MTAIALLPPVHQDGTLTYPSFLLLYLVGYTLFVAGFLTSRCAEELSYEVLSTLFFSLFWPLWVPVILVVIPSTRLVGNIVYVVRAWRRLHQATRKEPRIIGGSDDDARSQV